VSGQDLESSSITRTLVGLLLPPTADNSDMRLFHIGVYMNICTLRDINMRHKA
jgi:hypothetical protein